MFFPGEIRQLRVKARLNQKQFWSKVGVMQSAGSRYEHGAPIPWPVQELLRLAYVERIDLLRARHDDWAIANYLRTHDPVRFKALKAEARAWGRRRPRAQTPPP
ncbi:MAG: transcriptional regulator [Azoarcus sp.]|jgi:transcriptional regulator with XRE-family HTH domain|nr:transcriptional regulator [Azoarcus sp.]